MLTKTNIAGINFDSYVMNASGINDSTLEELEVIASSSSSAIVMKSCTLEPRQGNSGPRYVRLENGSIQCMGLPNLGYKKYIEFAKKLKEKYQKPVIASVAGLTKKDYPELVNAFQDTEVDMIEINVSCPNLADKKVFAYQSWEVVEILQMTKDLRKKPLGLKLPPYIHGEQQGWITRILEYGISFVTCINSLPNTLVIDNEKETPILRPKKGLGALCGSYIKPIALANVYNFFKDLEGGISIIGVGGIETGKDAFEFLLCGADAVQVGTCFEKQGPDCFRRINKELEEILERKGYNSIEQAKGKLKFL